MEKYIYIYVSIFFVVITPIALYFILKPIFRQKELLHGVVNYDTFMRKFLFRIELEKEEFFEQLKIHNINDILEYCLNEDCSVITFLKYNDKFPYKILIAEYNEYIVLNVEQIPTVMNKANVPYYINSFFIKKFNAKPIDYQKSAF